MSGYFAVKTYESLLREGNLQAVQAFEQFAIGLRADHDGEQGFGPKGALNWVHDHYNRGTQKENGLFQTFVVTDFMQQVVATATVCDDDRGVGIANGIGQDAFIGFVHVANPVRGQGIGNFIFDHVEQHITNWFETQTEKKSLDVVLFTNNPVAEHMYRKRGYEFKGSVYIPEWDSTEKRFDKVYRSPVLKPVAKGQPRPPEFPGA